MRISHLLFFFSFLFPFSINKKNTPSSVAILRFNLDVVVFTLLSVAIVDKTLEVEDEEVSNVPGL